MLFLRSFKELHDNYFPEIEKTAQDFAFENNFKTRKNIDIEHLEKFLPKISAYKIKSENFENTEHSTIFVRFTFGKNLLLLNQLLDENQKPSSSQKKLVSMFKTNTKT